MAIFNKGNVVFKHKAEDFIVEEISSEGKISNISSEANAFKNAKVEFNGIDLNDRRDFLMFDAEKINIDHFSLISILCDRLKKNPHEIGYLGTKDKVAWTSQRISVFNPDIERIEKFSHEGIILKNFKWGKHKLKIGDLKGNKFRITLRDCDEKAIKVLNRVRNTEYIPNFFGAQRFGSVRKDNTKIGKLILKKKYKEAVYAFLTGYGQKESKEIKEAKKRFKEENDINSAKSYFPSELNVEHRMIECLIKNKDDYIGALSIIGEKTILIMCQSVQSKIFNDILEKGIERGITSEEDSIIIPGYNLSNSEGKLKNVEKEVLEENDIDIEDFKNTEFQFLSLASAKRKAYFKVKEIDIKMEEDEEFEKGKKILISFILGSGSYATTYLENFFDLR